MLVIRMQRTGRSGHAQFRVVAQDGRFHPSSGRVVEYLGSYDPHTKTASLKKEKIEGLLSKGAQPSDRVIKLLKKEGYKLPKWVRIPAKKTKSTRNPDKFGSTESAAPATSAVEAGDNGEEAAAVPVAGEPEATAEPAASDAPAEAAEPKAEKPADETPKEPVVKETEPEPATEEPPAAEKRAIEEPPADKPAE